MEMQYQWRPGRAVLRSLLVAAGCLAGLPGVADDWPQWLGPQRDGVWRETGLLTNFPPNGLAVRWRTPLSAGYTGPAVAAGRVYVCDRLRVEGVSRERVLSLDEASGKILWQHEYDCPYVSAYPAGPRTTPAVAGGKAYTLGTEGHLFCFDAAGGKVLWSREFKKDFGAKTPVWGFAAHPLVDGRKLICITGARQSLVVALDKDTGQELWRALDAPEPGYAPPVIFEAGGRRQLIVWHPEALNSLDPDTGKLFWKQPFGSKAGLCISTPRKLGDLLFVTAFYNGPLMMRLAPDQPTATPLWRGRSQSEVNTAGLHSIISTPFLEDGHIYGVCSYGQLRCLKADSGERLWETLAAATDGKPARWANAFLIKNGDRFFLANEKGDLIIARLSPKGYAELSRTRLIEPTNRDCGRLVVWSHPAFANRCVYARNDKEILCASLAAEAPIRNPKSEIRPAGPERERGENKSE
jgi:outer membrane protein assembly factor BamB